MQTEQHPSPEQRTVGLIGVGLLGAALAERLIDGGFDVLGYDVDPARRAALARPGAEEAPSAGAVLSACPRVLLSLPDLDVVASVLSAEAAALRAGQMLIDTTTGAPPQAERLGAALAERGVAYLDATVSGSSAQVRRGEATLLVGGPADAFARCRDLLGSFARAAHHLGPCGSGARMKLVTNLVLGLNRAALAEGLAFAGALRLDAPSALALLRDGPAYSRVMDLKGAKMVRGDFEPEARLAQHLKDVRLILAAAEETGLPLPLSRAHRRLLEAAESAGCGALDNSAVIRAYPPSRAAGSAGGEVVRS
jgi:3-hydroxyisobutyrate dehydrogenase-like beta-hydroxyacid dehydrogenase